MINISISERIINKMIFKVDEFWDGRLLRDYLRSGCDVSRKTLCKLKALENGILLNGQRVTVRAVLKVGDNVELAIEDAKEDENPYVIPIGKMPPIIYEDDAVIAVNKPAGMPTHTSFGHYEDSLSNAVCLYLKNQGKPFVFRAINRLDRDTSGIVLIAKNRYYAGKLSASLEKGEFKKKYLAVANGETPDNGRIEGYISREGESIIKRCFSESMTDGADYSLTEYVTVSRGDGVSLIEASPITGRTHQIRVHMASVGHYLIGDTMYGERSDLISRQALHAYYLAFPSPIDGRLLEIKAPLYEDMLMLIKAYKINGINDEN